LLLAGSDPHNSSVQKAIGHLPNKYMPNVFMAVTIDLGDATSPFGSVHCRYKTEVGQRLALAARKVTYGENSAGVSTGPVFDKATFGSTTSDGMSIVILKFNNTGKGLYLPPMNISKDHPMGNWTGATPFELCTEPTSASATVPLTQQRSMEPLTQQRSMECLGPGAMEKGGDLMVAANMSLGDAQAWCQKNSSCVGFTAQRANSLPSPSPCDPDPSKVLRKVFFKHTVISVNTDAAWVSFDKPAPYCSLFTKYDRWSLAGSTHVTSSSADSVNDSVVLTVSPTAAAGVIKAVRFAWRAYPCEHQGCGIYSRVTDDLRLPPPSFWAEVLPASDERQQ
jgi:hypothetical protein